MTSSCTSRASEIRHCPPCCWSPARPRRWTGGTPSSAPGWRGGRHVVRYDHRDTGQSTTGTPGEPAYDGWQLERDCAGLIEALAVGPAHLVGISMGGGIAQVITLRRPELVSTLTLIATSAAGGVDADVPGPSAAVRASFDAPPPGPDWAAAVHARSRDPAAANNHWIVVTGDDEAETSEPPDVRRITAPTLVVHGSDDPFFPLPHGEALAAAIPGASMLTVPGMGHEVPPPDTWDLVVPALIQHTKEGRTPSGHP